jgi:hypothetical protein
MPGHTFLLPIDRLSSSTPETVKYTRNLLMMIKQGQKQRLLILHISRDSESPCINMNTSNIILCYLNDYMPISMISPIKPLRTEVYFCHQNQNAKNIGNFTALLKPHNIGTHLKGTETSFQVVPLFCKYFHFWVSYITC